MGFAPILTVAGSFRHRRLAAPSAVRATRAWRHVVLFLLTVAIDDARGRGPLLRASSSTSARRRPDLVRISSSSSTASGTASRFSPSSARTSSATTSPAATTASTRRCPIFSRRRFRSPARSAPSSASARSIPSKRELFDIGIAGPIAGFLVAVPVLLLGMSLSRVMALPADTSGFVELGEPLLFKAVAWLFWGTPPDGYSINMHPMAFAAWFGLLATALNLFPIGQLDGGHISYAVLGRKSTLVTLATVAVPDRPHVRLVLVDRLDGAHGRHAASRSARGIRGRSTRTCRSTAGAVAGASFALLMFILCFTPARSSLWISSAAHNSKPVSHGAVTCAREARTRSRRSQPSLQHAQRIDVHRHPPPHLRHPGETSVAAPRASRRGACP